MSINSINLSVFAFFLVLICNLDKRWNKNNLLGAVAEFRKVTISFIMSVCLSVCLSVWLSVCLPVFPRETTRLPPNRFSLNLTFQYFSKIYRENSNLFKI